MDNRTDEAINERYRKSTKSLILLDYDGTLVNYTSQPSKAILAEEITKIVRSLAGNPNTELFIITGRSRKDIDRFLNHTQINIIAEHGALIKIDGKWKNQISVGSRWKKTIIPVLDEATSGCPDSYIEEKMFSLAWHYRNADPVIGFSISRALINQLEEVIRSLGLKILDGNKVVEILTIKTGKGKAVKNLYMQNKYDFILSIGDDVTDEEMFEFFSDKPDAFTVKVGKGSTKAKYRLRSTSSVASLLKHMSE
jgi:trehalose 6-phosphate synthase/phosphatase